MKKYLIKKLYQHRKDMINEEIKNIDNKYAVLKKIFHHADN